jgi:glycosyltransferase involved in cell wall biosynthesis
MEQTVKLTVITPVYNGIKYIEACLQNVISQNAQGVEHLVIDGQSTDGTPQLVQQYLARYPHIRLISEKDKGQSDAMNKGIQAAKGSIIGFLNVDDYYEPGVLPRVLQIFSTLPEPSFIVGNLNVWSAEGQLKLLNKPTHTRITHLVSDLFEWPYNPSAYFYHKSLHQLTGLYDTQEHYALDYHFIMRASMVVSFHYFNETWGNFRELPGTKTYQDIQNNTAYERAKRIRRQFYRKLNLYQKLQVKWLQLQWLAGIYLRKLGILPRRG